MKGITKSHNNPFQKPSVKTIFYLVCLGTIFFAGCSRYQCVTIGSYLYKNEYNEFIAEDDTVRVTYSFSGTDFPIRLTVFNKLQQPLYFDPEKSKIIMNDHSVSDAFETDDQLYSIGAQSATTIKCNPLSDKFIPLSDKDSIINIAITTNQGSQIVKQHIFNENTTPVFFSSVLAFSVQPDFYDAFFYEHPFWVSGIYQTIDMVPYNLPSNQFSMRKTTNFASFMGCTGLTVLTIALLLASPENTGYE